VKKVVFTLMAMALVCQPADAQFFKKLFKKKKAKTEKKAPVKTDGIDDDAQTAMFDIASSADNTNNRNAFMGIPIGIKADRFEKLLLEKGFEERKAEGKQTAKSYIYTGQVYGARSTVTLAVSDQTGRVYAVDIADEMVYNSEKDVKTRFQFVKEQLQKVYGSGYVDNQGEAYTIQTRLGTVSLHYERGLAGSYSLGFALDDAKAYQMAYNEMSDKEYEAPPRKIENGLATINLHTDIVGLGVRLLKDKTLASAKKVFLDYDYVVGKATAKQQNATFTLDDYQSTVMLTRKKQSFTAVDITANDDLESVKKDLQLYGFTTTDSQNFQQGKMTATLSTDAQGRVVLRMK
jgi:hypothetical protein